MREQNRHCARRVDAVMIDAPRRGSGPVFRLELTDGVPDDQRLVVAGGLTPDNVAEAIARGHP